MHPLFITFFHIPLYVSSNSVLIIRRNYYCKHTASGSLYVTLNILKKFYTLTKSLNCLQSDIQRTRCCVYTIVPPDDEHNIARNM